MFQGIRRDLRTIVISIAAASVVMAAPAVARQVVNAHTVDGKHAVGASASAKARAGKLVATNRYGRLPNNIVAKPGDADRLDGKDSSAFLGASGTATDSDKLDGKDSSAFLGATETAADSRRLGGRDASAYARVRAEPGELLTGEYAVVGGSGLVGAYVPFNRILPAALMGARTTLVPYGGTNGGTECPGPGRVGVPGWLCVYETGPDARSLAVAFDPKNWVFGAEADQQDILGTRGFVMWGTGKPSGTSYSTGVWAIEAAAPGARLAGITGKGGYGRPGD